MYLFGGVPPYIYADLGGTDRWVWFVLANLLSLAAVCPDRAKIDQLEVELGVETAKEEREQRGREGSYQGVSTAWHVETWSDLSHTTPTASDLRPQWHQGNGRTVPSLLAAQALA